MTQRRLNISLQHGTFTYPMSVRSSSHAISWHMFSVSKNPQAAAYCENNQYTVDEGK